MELDADNETASDIEKAASFTKELEIGRLEPASIQLVEGTGKLLIKTNREGWRAWCYCHNRRYEIAPAELEPVGTRMHTSKLNRSIFVVNGGDSHLAERVLQRSLSLVRRYPSPESIDLTFATVEMEERLRIWVDKNLTIKPVDAGSSWDILKALQGRSPSDVSDVETAVFEDQPTPKPTPKLQRAVVQKGPAAVHPARRRGSAMPLKSQLEQWGSSSGGGGGGGSSISEPGRGLDVPKGVVSEAAAPDEGDESDTDLLTWKEPPVLRKLGTGSGGGGSSSLSRGGASSRGKGISALSGGEPSPTDQQLRRKESARAAGRAAMLDSARTPSSGERGQKSSSGSLKDFWNPLGLMPEDSQTKPSRGLHRGIPAFIGPAPEGGGDGAEEGSSQHSTSSRRASRRGVPFKDDAPAPGGGGQGQGAHEDSSHNSTTAQAPDDAE